MVRIVPASHCGVTLESLAIGSTPALRSDTGATTGFAACNAEWIGLCSSAVLALMENDKMRMPQDFVDEINAAVSEINPNAGRMISGSMTLGSDFDEWLGPQAMGKYGLGPMPPEDMAAFEAKFAQHREKLKASLVASAVEVEKQRLAGTLEDLDCCDSYQRR
jgi:hypothetical protein